MLDMRDTLIHTVMNRWPTVSYSVREKASDAALEALESGKSLLECVEVARETIEQK